MTQLWISFSRDVFTKGTAECCINAEVGWVRSRDHHLIITRANGEHLVFAPDEVRRIVLAPNNARADDNRVCFVAEGA